MATNLKHFDRYRRALKRYAKAINISLRYDPKAEDDGYYSPLKHVIKIDSELTEVETIAATLHELGHALDDAISWEGNKLLTDKIKEAYARTYSKRPANTKQRRLVLKCERAAWKYGRVIAKKLGIKLGKWYDAYMDECLKSYKAKA